jgi:hypothetical protein
LNKTTVETKRTVILTASLFLFIISLASVINPVMANPVWTQYFPIEPVKTQPKIEFQSPIQSEIYSSQEIWLNFTITKPDSWYLYTEDVTDEQGNPSYFNLVNITSVGYTVDGKENIKLPISDVARFYESFPNTRLNYSVRLSLSEGTHSVRVWYKADSFYPQTDYYSLENQTQAWPAGTRNYYDSVLPAPLEGSSGLIYFSITCQDSFPTTAVIVLVAGIILAAGLFLCFKNKSPLH